MTTKKELLQMFEDYDLLDDDEIAFAYPSGDYWGTTLVKKINVKNSDFAECVYSKYHNCLELPDENKLYRIKSENNELEDGEEPEKIHYLFVLE